jgi:magnesium transporter
MIRIFFHTEIEIQRSDSLDALKQIANDKLLWVDLQYASVEEKQKVELFFKIDFKEQKEISNIESNSRFYEAERFIYINSNFISKQEGLYINCPVTFFLLGHILITERDADLPSFAETVKKMKRNRLLFENGRDVLEGILETKVDIDGDFIEAIAKEISLVSNGLSLNTTNEEELLIKINSYQENAMLLRESFIDKQRVVSALLKISDFKHDSRFKFVIKDINSMLEYSSFIFTRLEYLQNTLLGMINMQQNKTIKIFTIVSVMFLPPTLIASIYGMNFNSMPELNWKFGYPFALILIVSSSFLTLYLFKRKKWL